MKNTKNHIKKRGKKMIKIIFDNGETYTYEQYKKDFVRYFKTEIGERRKHSTFQEEDCSNLPCAVCIANISNIDSHSFTQCQQNLFNSFQVIKNIHDCAKEHPVVTNRDKIKDVFGFNMTSWDDAKLNGKDFDFNKWLSSEYKEPNKDD